MYIQLQKIRSAETGLLLIRCRVDADQLVGVWPSIHDFDWLCQSWFLIIFVEKDFFEIMSAKEKLLFAWKGQSSFHFFKISKKGTTDTTSFPPWFLHPKIKIWTPV